MILIGRQAEKEQLERIYDSGRPEFVALYGRRRVGKTYLINEVFRDRMTFSMTGVLNEGMEAQRMAFVDAMDLYGEPVADPPATWYDAFRLLRRFLTRRMAETKGRCVVFIDELPCLDTRGSGFVNALGHFWNSWASLQPRLMLIVCGSATSWMKEQVIDSHGGLHDRITHEIHLREFTLGETEQYLQAQGFPWDRTLVLQTYMVMGGVPYYLGLLLPQECLAQNIDRLFFQPGATMRREFQRLYHTLFSSPEPYIAIVEALFKRKGGLTRDEIAAAIGRESNGRLTKMLQNLVDCDLVRFYRVRNKKVSARGGLYQLLDFFSLFYLQFMADSTTDGHFWSKSLATPTVNTWMGLAFERVCLAHVEQIKRALRIEAIRNEYYSWRSVKDDSGSMAQIDLVIERADRMVNICEAKYSEAPYALNKDEYMRFQRRMMLFQQQTAFRGGIIPTFLTVNGLQRNAYSEHILAVITLDHLFALPLAT